MFKYPYYAIKVQGNILIRIDY